MRAASVEARREGLARLMQMGREEYPVAEIREISLPGGPQPLAARLYVPTEPSSLSTSAPAPGILYLHGGGLVAGNLDTHEPIARALCRYSGLRLLSLGYRLAPEAPFPSALEDVRRTLEYLARQAPSLGFASD